MIKLKVTEMEGKKGSKTRLGQGGRFCSGLTEWTHLDYCISFWMNANANYSDYWFHCAATQHLIYHNNFWEKLLHFGQKLILMWLIYCVDSRSQVCHVLKCNSVSLSSSGEGLSGEVQTGVGALSRPRGGSQETAGQTLRRGPVTARPGQIRQEQHHHSVRTGERTDLMTGHMFTL